MIDARFRKSSAQSNSGRCKEKLDYLSILVKNTWPKVRLRVVEAWDQQGTHSPDSLHYEGRAVDITTSDKDRRKLGLLARRAVQAGFDYVYYESRNHVHVSCKSDSATNQKKVLRCFPGSSTVISDEGVTAMDKLQVGQKILALDQSGNLVMSPVIGFLDRVEDTYEDFFRITVRRGPTIHLTPYHLIYRLKIDPKDVENSCLISPATIHNGRNDISFPGNWHKCVDATFAKNILPGSRVLVRETLTDSMQTFRKHDSRLDLNWKRLEQHNWTIGVVETVSLIQATGAYSPLTLEGNLVVDNVVASCYAAILDEQVAHTVMGPKRLLYRLKHFFDGLKLRLPDTRNGAASLPQVGIDSYSNLLLKISDWLSPLFGKFTV